MGQGALVASPLGTSSPYLNQFVMLLRELRVVVLMGGFAEH